jgi:hypothetical protein
MYRVSRDKNDKNDEGLQLTENGLISGQARLNCAQLNGAQFWSTRNGAKALA